MMGAGCPPLPERCIYFSTENRIRRKGQRTMAADDWKAPDRKIRDERSGEVSLLRAMLTWFSKVVYVHKGFAPNGDTYHQMFSKPVADDYFKDRCLTFRHGEFTAWSRLLECL